MDADFINPFLNSTINVLKTMAQTEVFPQKPTVKNHKKCIGDITGIIGMASESLSGSLVLSFSKPCILHILAKMFNEPVKDTIDDDVVDAVGEITNMICGGVKAELSKKDYTFNLATPTMIKGKGVEISYQNSSPTIVIPFKTAHGDFVIEANLVAR
jgi:chemotaxis protein CheX